MTFSNLKSYLRLFSAQDNLKCPEILELTEETLNRSFPKVNELKIGTLLPIMIVKLK